MKEILPSGKLPQKVLKRLLDRYAPEGPGVIVGPGIGLDAAVISPRGRRLIAKTDPITFVAGDIGAYAIDINANDIAVMGGVPRWFLAAILLPQGSSTVGTAQEIFAQISRACRKNGVTLCGGHTEITPAVNRPVVVGQMIGELRGERIITAAGARAGDDIILTKGIAIEAVSIIARELKSELERLGFTGRFIARCRNYVKNPGISVIKEAGILLRYKTHAMHDPTEGGLAGALYELAQASNCGILIYRELVNELPEAVRICKALGLDPMGAIASGSLVAAIDAADTRKALTALAKAGIRAWRIGRITAKRFGITEVDETGAPRPLTFFERDEIARLLGGKKITGRSIP